MLARRPPTTVCLRAAARRHLSTDYHQGSPELPPPSLSTTRPVRPRLSPSPRPTQSSGPLPVTSSSTLSTTPTRRPFKLPPTFGRNQFLEVPNSTRALLEEIVGTFRAPIRYAFAYGSGVFEQGGSAGVDKDKKPMLDFMFAVTHPAHWHSINLAQNPHHYPSHAQWLGSDFITKVQEIGPAAVWFNAFVPISGVTIKYGITTVDNLCSDLLTWKSLYLAGRMHKPLRIIKDDPRVRLTQQVNLTSAVRAALLTLPESFDEKELYQRIAGLSYRGDPRMALPFENRQKVANIVDAQANLFKDVYHRLVVGLPGVHWPATGSTIQQDMNPLTRASHLRKLPSNLVSRIDRHYLGATGIPPKDADPTEYWMKLAGDPALANVLQNEVQGIVRYPATVQSMKGLVTAGVSSSVKYVGRKVGKWWRSSSTP